MIIKGTYWILNEGGYFLSANEAEAVIMAKNENLNVFMTELAEPVDENRWPEYYFVSWPGEQDPNQRGARLPDEETAVEWASWNDGKDEIVMAFEKDEFLDLLDKSRGRGL